MSQDSAKRYLIIGGTTKAATTSLYFYLQDHPEVCVSSIKETRYFLDPAYPLDSDTRYDGMDNAYDAYFSHATEGQLLAEATPDYLYSPVTASWLSRLYAEQVHMLFLLRDPISRVESWYKFARQDGHLPMSLSIDEYIEQMFEGLGKPDLPQYMRALEQGRYAHYLAPWFKEFTAEQIQIVFFEDVKAAPLEVMQSIAKKTGIDPAFYENYTAEVKNETKALKNPGLHQAYKRFRFIVRNRTHKIPFIHKRLAWLRRTFEPFYLKLNEAKSEPAPVISDAMQERLISYYQPDVNALKEMVNLPEAWQQRYISVT